MFDTVKSYKIEIDSKEITDEMYDTITDQSAIMRNYYRSLNLDILGDICYGLKRGWEFSKGAYNKYYVFLKVSPTEDIELDFVSEQSFEQSQNEEISFADFFRYLSDWRTQNKLSYNEREQKMAEQNNKTLDVKDSKDLLEKVSDVEITGNPDLFKLVAKASSKKQGWMKSTKICNLPNGCLVQVTTQQDLNVAEALQFVPKINYNWDTNSFKYLD